MQITTSVTELFHIEYPIIQAGMVWVSGHKLASAVSNAGGLGLIGAGSMKPDLLREHIHLCRQETTKPFGVNVPLLRGDAADLISVVTEEKVPIVFTAAGSPAKYIESLKKAGCTVVHVVSSVKQALKAQSAGCDAVVGEGVEAGGHNGADETTTLCLIPAILSAVTIPVIAAGGIATGSQIAAMLALGAAGVQIGSRFAATVESSAHAAYKQAIIEAGDGGTLLAFRKTGMIRMIRNDFALRASNAELQGASPEELKEILGEKRERRGIFEGDIKEGALEAGQSSTLIEDLPTVSVLMDSLVTHCAQALRTLQGKVSGL